MVFGKSDGTTPDPMLGKVLGGCVLEARIGRGGMGTVYRATREVDRQAVAIKILAPFLAADDAVVTRFTREVRAASRVRNPNVIRVMGCAEEGGIHFSIMEFVDGENLADLLDRKGHLAVGHAAFIAREVARGLAALHAEGILHRDVKPSNILIGRDHSVKITDFGIARDIFDLQRLTAPGDLLGTLGFAAPEQLERSEGDARADLYSLGATLYTMLSGVRPPASQNTPLPPLSKDVPEALRELVSRLLSIDPAARPADAKSVASALYPYCRLPEKPSFKAMCLRIAIKLAGAGLVLWAGALATASHGHEFHADPWTLVLPARGSGLPSGGLFGLGVLVAFFAFMRGREKVGMGPRSILGFSFLAGALVVCYMAGATIGTVTLRDAALTIASRSPQVLLIESLALAACGLLVGMRKPGRPSTRVIGGALILAALAAATTASSAGSFSQAVDDLQRALSRDAWAWLAFVLAGAGIVLGYRDQGRLWTLLLASTSVLASLGLVYWASQGKGSPSLDQALSAPGGEFALAILLALGARAIFDLRPSAGSPPGPRSEFETTGSSSTPRPLT